MSVDEQAYFAFTPSNISVNRSDTTSLATEPEHISDLMREVDLNALMYKYNIIPSYVEDVNESSHEKGVDPNKFFYNVATDTHVAKIEVIKTLTDEEKVELTYTDANGTRTSGIQIDEATAMVELSKQLKVTTDTNTTTKIVSLLAVGGGQDVGSSMAKVIVTEESSANVAVQGGIEALLAELKGGPDGKHWYDGSNQSGMHIQVKNGLAQLFDRDPNLNNLIGSAVSSATFLDSDKIKTMMMDPINQFYKNLFSDGQLREVLDAVSDKGDRMFRENADRQFLFQNGDSITAIVTVTDNDSGSTNSDRWLVTLKHLAPADEGEAQSHTVSKKFDRWGQMGADINGEDYGDQSGYSVSLSSDGLTMAIGSPYHDEADRGHVRIYKFDGDNWVQMGDDIDGEASGDNSGYSVSLSGDGSIVAIGAILNDGNGYNSGHVRIYKFDENANPKWVQMGQTIDGEAAGDFSGYSVSLDDEGTIVAIGAYHNSSNAGDNNNNRGHVRIYKFDENVIPHQWGQLGGDIDGESDNDYSGRSVSLSGDGSMVAIGSTDNNGTTGDNTDYRGHVRIYKFDENATPQWGQRGGDIDGEASGDESGHSVSLNNDGDIVAIGAYLNDGANGANSGHVRIYKFDGDNWGQRGGDIDGEASGDYSGYSMSLSDDGSIVAIGADSDNGGTDSGHVRIYKFENNSWVQMGDDIDGEAAYDYSGYSVSLSGDGSTVAIGANYSGGNGYKSGHVRVYSVSTLYELIANSSAGGHSFIANYAVLDNKVISIDGYTGTTIESDADDKSIRFINGTNYVEPEVGTTVFI